jgi:hypothetical protein
MSDTATHVFPEGARPRFAPGNNAYAARRLAVEARYAALLAEYAADSLSTKCILRIAAQHIVDSERARNATLRVRSSNAAARLLSKISKRKARVPSLTEMGL